jgi:hypothetical protein
MKSITTKGIAIRVQTLVLIAAVIAWGCGGGSDPAPAETEKVKQILTNGNGTWTPPSNGGVTVDGVDVTDDLFPGFSITFYDGTFTTTGTSPVWLREDSWTFKDDAAKVIIRGQDQREITITEISATQLKLTLEWPQTTNGGRAGSLKGKHEFTLIK